MSRGWVACTLGEAVRQESRRVGSEPGCEVLSSTKHHGLVPSTSYFKGRQIFSDDLSGYRVVEPDWFAYATNHLAEGSLGINNTGESGCVSPMYTVFSAQAHVDPAYLFRVLKSPELLEHYSRHEQASVDRRGSIRFGAFAQIPVVLPPLEEQRRIAEILDAIDETIQASERVLAKLGATRVGMVADLLRPDDDWVGASVGELLRRIESGKSPDAPDRRPGAGEWGVLKVSAVHSSGFRPNESKVLRSDQVRTQDEVRPGDVLITRANTPELVGMCCFVGATPGRLQLSDKTLRLVPSPIVDPEFLALTLQSSGIRRQIERDGTGSSGSMKNISQSEIKALWARWPSVERQISITETVQDLDSRLAEEAEVMTKIRRMRAGLASDLLSGRVRTVAA